jgi:hypothetical protein
VKINKTVSDKVISANQANSLKSTGPQSAAAKSALKYHAVKHGLLTKALSFRDEEEEKEFQQLADDLAQDLKPRGIFQAMLVEEIAVCWWKLQTVQRMQLKELCSRQKVSAAILTTFIKASRYRDPLSLQAGELHATTDYGWECSELLVTVDDKSDEKEIDSDDATEKIGRIAFRAKLGNSAESLLRYECAWKKDLYRAIAALKLLQQDE